MTLPPNLTAKNSILSIRPKLYAHVKPWRPPQDVNEAQIERAKKRIASRHNYEESVARRKAKAQATFIRLQKKFRLS